MAKKTKKDKKKLKKMSKKHKAHAAKWGAATGALAGFAGDVLVRVAANLINDTLDSSLKKGAKKKGAQGDEALDAPARLLTVLAERGPQSVPDLLFHSAVPLSAMLRALRDVREFRLIEFVGDDDAVHLTDAGNRTATVLSKHRIRTDAARLLSA